MSYQRTRRELEKIEKFVDSRQPLSLVSGDIWVDARPLVSSVHVPAPVALLARDLLAERNERNQEIQT